MLAFRKLIHLCCYYTYDCGVRCDENCVITCTGHVRIGINLSKQYVM
jgi:hypothetical protein